ncbi:ABC transporter permease [Streptomyces phaeolivaceus]|uniref:ABC transporter permease n=1 Tax=Streptomyces phaeolivaceus TaxID=2653200 RepID=A0A5P8K8S8_9ACTN|nr:ABC transporter permease [Streptomyces phaeolivaceus]QFQ99420.1 ABC transporter permease [Streptomyces phaeolivaceus]
MSKQQNSRTDVPVVVAEPAWAFVLIGGVFALVGAGIGLGIKFLAKWFVTLPWAPMQGPAELLTSIPEPGLSIGLAALGAVLGLVAGALARHDALSVSVSPAQVVLERKGKSREFERETVALVFRDGKQLILLGRRSEELVREGCDLNAQALADAFTSRGYTWADSDPYQNEYRRWVPDTPGLPEGANAVLKARSQALAKKGGSEEAQELREELSRLGVVVRDNDKRQFWRLVQR